VTIELINTGSELLLGRVLNTHQQWICRQLADLGYTVNRQVAVPDDGRHHHGRAGADVRRHHAGTDRSTARMQTAP
jgi:Probable molybdopterin binding domain